MCRFIDTRSIRLTPDDGSSSSTLRQTNTKNYGQN